MTTRIHGHSTVTFLLPNKHDKLSWFHFCIYITRAFQCDDFWFSLRIDCVLFVYLGIPIALPGRPHQQPSDTLGIEQKTPFAASNAPLLVTSQSAPLTSSFLSSHAAASSSHPSHSPPNVVTTEAHQCTENLCNRCHRCAHCSALVSDAAHPPSYAQTHAHAPNSTTMNVPPPPSYASIAHTQNAQQQISTDAPPASESMSNSNQVLLSHTGDTASQTSADPARRTFFFFHNYYSILLCVRSLHFSYVSLSGTFRNNGRPLKKFFSLFCL